VCDGDGERHEVEFRIDLSLDGEIVALVEINPSFDEAIDQVFAPFEAWLIENHPDDVPRLFGEVDGAGFTVTDQSVPLWGQRTRST